MEKHKVIGIVILVILMSCNSTKKSISSTDETVNEVSEFERIYDDQFINVIPTLQLPFTINCGHVEFIMDESSRENLRPFCPAGYNLIGKIGTKGTNNLVLYIEDNPEAKPVLTITDNAGTNMKFYSLYKNPCYESDTVAFYSTATIISDKLISIENSMVFKNGLRDSMIVRKKALDIINTDILERNIE
ncbi:MAG: hypothetical protein R2852_04380 [Bacteroidia bacterium]